MTKLQLELLKVYSFEPSEEDLIAVKRILGRYFAQRLRNEVDEAIQEKGITPKELAYQALSNEPNRQSYFSSDPSLRRGFGRQEGGKTGVMPKHNAFMSRHSSSGRIFPTPSRRERTSLWGSGFSAWCTRFLVVAANSFADDIIYTATEVAATLPE